MDAYRQIVLASRPIGIPTPADFRLETGSLPVPSDGQLLLQTKYLSLDPYMRGRMNDAKSYAAPVELGEVMEGEVIAEILESRHPAYRQGDLVQGRTGWRTHAAVNADAVWRVETGGNPPTTALGVLGMPGFTAYAGMKVIGQSQTGETVVVAAASGPGEGSPCRAFNLPTAWVHLNRSGNIWTIAASTLSMLSRRSRSSEMRSAVSTSHPLSIHLTSLFLVQVLRRSLGLREARRDSGTPARLRRGIFCSLSCYFLQRGAPRPSR
jgi:hypothetical protein